MNRPWIKPLVRILACLLAGAMVTVALAWAAVIRWPHVPSIRTLDELERVWHIDVPSDWPSIPETNRVALSKTVTWQQSFVHNVWPLASGSRIALSAEVGLPFRSVRMQSLLSEGGPRHKGSIATPAWLNIDERLAGRLPIQPLFPGFALNTLFYATLLFTLWTTPARARRHLRRRRGHCPACNYDLRGLTTPCPECGAPQ